MQIRTSTLVWSAAGLLAVGTATGLAAPALLQSAPSPTAAAAPADSSRDAAPQAIPLMTAPNYRAIVARNQAAVVAITTAGPVNTSAPLEGNFGDSNGDGNPLGQFFRGLPMPRQHGGVQHA